jgi:hypothetical protein
MPIESEGHLEFLLKVRNFPEEVYSFDPSSRLYQFMWAILEDPGIGQLRKVQAVARLSESMGGTNFSDLDVFFGARAGIARMPDEQYSYDPFRQQLSVSQWDEIALKDASYRHRLAMFFQSILRGGTNEGIAMAAEAACGWPCTVLEVWRANSTLGLSALGRLQAAKEFVIVPSTTSLTVSQERAIYQVVKRIQPANTLCTVDENGLGVHSLITVRRATSPSSYFEVRRYVAFRGAPAPLPQTRVWVKVDKEVEAPLFAHLRSQETEWDLNASITGSSSFTLAAVYPQRIGQLHSDVLIGDLTIVVDESGDPPSPGLRVQVGSEVMIVTKRDSGPGSSWTYTVSRGQDGTAAAGHVAGDQVSSNYIPMASTIGTQDKQWGPWREIVLEDSPDNFPSGKYPGAAERYDLQGNYVFAWTSQAQYVSWLTQQITALGGEVSQNAYRLPADLEAVPGWATRAEYALAPPLIEVRSTYYPGAIEVAAGLAGPTAQTPPAAFGGQGQTTDTGTSQNV